jgi:hypothetical protein
MFPLIPIIIGSGAGLLFGGSKKKYAQGGELGLFQDIRDFENGGEIPKNKSLRHFILNEASSGMIANKIPYSDYRTIDNIRITAVQILNRDGDREYTMRSFADLIQEALLEYEENKRELNYAKGGEVYDYKRMYYLFQGTDHKNNKPLYRVESTSHNPNEYVGEWHTNKKDALSELKGLDPLLGFNLVYEKWSKIMGGNGVSGSIRTTPENYYVATINENGEISFDDLEANTRGIDKKLVSRLWKQGEIKSK